MDNQEIKNELSSIKRDLINLIDMEKKAAFQLDPVKHGITDLEDKSQSIAAVLNEILEQTTEIKRELAHGSESASIIRWDGSKFVPAKRFVPELMGRNDRAIANVIAFSRRLRDMASTLEKETRDIQMQKAIRNAPVPEDAPARRNMLQRATDLLGRIIPSFN